MKQVQWAIIGCGAVTEVKSGPAFNKVSNSKLVAVMRRNGEKAKDYANRHKVPKWYDDAQNLINDPEVNAIYVATPPDSHAEYAIRAMKAGKPVYVEKPMARNYEECLEMNSVSRETGIPLFVAYYRRSLPGFLLVKELVENNRIGNVRYVNLRFNKPFMEGDLDPANLQWRVIPSISGGGHFFDLASHQLDYLDFLFGPVIKVNSIVKNQGRKYQAEDIVLTNFEFKTGTLGTGSWCFTTDPSANEDVLEIVGEKGKIVFSTFDPIPVKLITSEGEKIFEYKNPNNIQFHLIQSIVNELTKTGKCISTGESAARTARVMDKIVKSYYT